MLFERRQPIPVAARLTDVRENTLRYDVELSEAERCELEVAASITPARLVAHPAIKASLDGYREKYAEKLRKGARALLNSQRAYAR